MERRSGAACDRVEPVSLGEAWHHLQCTQVQKAELDDFSNVLAAREQLQVENCDLKLLSPVISAGPKLGTLRRATLCNWG